MLIVVTMFSVINYRSLIDNVDYQSSLQYQRYVTEVENLIEQTSNNSRQLIRLIPFLKEMDTALVLQDSAQITQAFEQHWSLFQLHNGIETIRFYDQSDQLLVGWDNFEEDSQRDALILEQVHDVNSQELPASLLICIEMCLQYTIEPLLIDGVRAGAMVIGASLADVFLGFKRTFGSDIGLLLKMKADSLDIQQNDVEFSNWGVRLAALTNREKNLEILHQIAQSHPTIQDLRGRIHTEWDNRHHRIKLLSFRGVNVLDRAYLVVLTDITPTILSIRDSTWRIIIIGLVGLLVSELILFAILSLPL